METTKGMTIVATEITAVLFHSATISSKSNSNPNYTIQYDTPHIGKLLKKYGMDKFNLKLNNSTTFKRIGISTNGLFPNCSSENNDPKL